MCVYVCVCECVYDTVAAPMYCIYECSIIDFFSSLINFYTPVCVCALYILTANVSVAQIDSGWIMDVDVISEIALTVCVHDDMLYEK